MGGEGFNLLQCCYLQAISYVKVQFSDKVAGLYILDKTQRMIRLLCAILQVMSYSLYTVCLLIKCTYYVL